jgi:hypothetical protein
VSLQAKTASANAKRLDAAQFWDKRNCYKFKKEMRALLNSNHWRHLLVFSDGGVVGNHPQSIANMVIHVCYDLEALCHSFPFSVLKPAFPF